MTTHFFLGLIFYALTLLTAPGVVHASPTESDVQWSVAILPSNITPTHHEQLLQPAINQRFIPWAEEAGIINLGYTPNDVWLRLRVERPAQTVNTWVLDIPYQGLQEIDIYLPTGKKISGGYARPRPAEQLEHRTMAFPLPLEIGTNDIYIRVHSPNALTIPIQIWTPRDFLRHVQHTSVLQALYFGALAAMTLYNLFLAISLRDSRFWLYVFFAIFLGLGMFSGNGYGRLYVWPNAHAFDSMSQSIFLSLAGAFSIAFSRTFLHLAQRQPKLNSALRWGERLLVSYCVLLLLSIAYPLPQQLILKFLGITILPIGSLIVWAGAQALKQQVKGVRFFMLAWSVLWVGVFTSTFRIFGWLPSNTFTMYATQIASALEMLLLAFAMADILNQERDERHAAQSLALKLEKDLVAQLRQSEEKLEKAVHERTAQLTHTLEQQRHLLDQYVRFGALISHEFRNPLGIIQSQISLLRKIQRTEDTEQNLEKRLNIMGSATRRLLQLFERWLQGDRLRHLGTDLQLEPLDLVTWTSDLLASHPEYLSNHRIEFISPKNDAFNGEIITDESLLEIAVLNLLDNACKYSAAGSLIQFHLKQNTDQLGLCITDQGMGIAAEQQQAIFSDYLRLHPEGHVHGLGLGLAFVRRIAELLSGSIELHSTVGQGSSFCFWLPRATPTSHPSSSAPA